MSDKLQFVAQSDKLKHVGHQTSAFKKKEVAVFDYLHKRIARNLEAIKS